MDIKICSKCGIPKDLLKFHKDNRLKSGLRPDCKECQKEYYIQNKIYILKREKNYRKNNMEKMNIKSQNFRIKKPWIKHLSSARQRCTNTNNVVYKYYGGKGIRCLLTSSEIKELWFRDKAYDMKKPSIDRKNSKKDYILKNCRFIEHPLNCSQTDISNRIKTVLQFDLNNNFIKKWSSIISIERELGFSNQGIGKCALGKQYTAYGYIWRYKT